MEHSLCFNNTVLQHIVANSLR